MGSSEKKSASGKRRQEDDEAEKGSNEMMTNIYKDVTGERWEMNAHGKRGGKFGARSTSYPELGGHVLTPEFGWAQRQRL